jgi:hypothetical protein
MTTSSQSSISPAITRTLTATVIAVILVAANFTIINAQQQPPPQQQTQLQSSSDGGAGLTALQLVRLLLLVGQLLKGGLAQM